MSNYPSRCQHIKTNGTQCGSPALRHNRFCFFHKRYQDESIRLNTDRRRRTSATFFLPVLEDANSAQMSLMQITRLLLTGQIEHKTASLVLYALQTASSNLRQTTFNPHMYDVVLDPCDSAHVHLKQLTLWSDKDFVENKQKVVDPAEQDLERKCDEAAEKARNQVRVEARLEAERRERARKLAEKEEKLKSWIRRNPGHRLVRRDGELLVERIPQAEPQPNGTTGVTPQPAAPEVPPPAQTAATTHETPKTVPDACIQAAGVFHPKLPALLDEYNRALQKEAEQQAQKKPPQKETNIEEAEKKSV